MQATSSLYILCIRNNDSQDFTVSTFKKTTYITVDYDCMCFMERNDCMCFMERNDCMCFMEINDWMCLMERNDCMQKLTHMTSLINTLTIEPELTEAGDCTACNTPILVTFHMSAKENKSER